MPAPVPHRELPPLGERGPGGSPRPYLLTSGRTLPEVELAVEALIRAMPQPWVELDDVNAAIVSLCRQSPSVAEIASLMDLPLGVARVLVADLVAAGHVQVLATLHENSTDSERRELIERVLSGLREI